MTTRSLRFLTSRSRSTMRSRLPRSAARSFMKPASLVTNGSSKERRITGWEQRRLDQHPEKMRQRRETVEHPFGTIKARMGATHFLMKTLPRVATEMALHILAYNLTRGLSHCQTCSIRSSLLSCSSLASLSSMSSVLANPSRTTR
jgi:hypothetical protein